MNLRKEYEDLKSKMAMIMEESEKQENEPKDFELFMRFSDDKAWLLFGFNDSENFRSIGCISNIGRCHLINEDLRRRNWEIWKENGFKVAEQEPVEWQGLEWIIDKNWKLRIFGKFPNCVYDFSEKRAYDGLEADNDFLKKDSDNRIHLY
jgi:hypothetical protein